MIEFQASRTTDVRDYLYVRGLKMKNLKPPHKLTNVGLSMFVNTVKLRKLLLPIVEVDIKKLIWHFDMPVWAKDKTDGWNLTPREVIKKLKGSRGHQKRVEAADTRHPIIITKYKSKYVVLDGIHRLLKIYVTGGKKIRAKIIPKKYLSMRESQS